MRIRFSIKTKLVIAFLLVASLVGLTSYASITSLSKVHDEYDTIIRVQVPGVEALENLNALALEVRSETLLYQQAIEQGASKEEATSQKNHVLADLDRITEAEHDYLRVEATEAEHSEDDESESQTSVTSARQEMVASVVDLIVLQEKRAAPELVAAKEKEVAEKQEALATTVGEVLGHEFEHISEGDEAADTEAAHATRNALLIAGLSGFIAVLVGLIISLIIARRIKRLEDGMTHIAAGDFSHKVVITSRDELGHLASSFNQMSERLTDSYQRVAYGKQRDEALIESMSEGLVAVDQGGKIVLLNKVAAQLFAVPSQTEALDKQFIGVQIYDSNDQLVPEERNPAYVTLRTGQQSGDVFSYKSATRKILLNISSSPIVLNGKVVGAIVVLRDVTKEKEIDRMKTEFISLASHQLRTPLSAIKWFAEMLVNGDAGELTDEQKDFAQNISDSTERMIDLVNSLLNISRIESGRIIVDPKPTDLQELVNGIINDLKAKTEDKQQSLIVSVHKELGKINIDPHLIGQVYMNFLTNAIKYTPKGGEISVFISRKGDQVVSQITDNGYGIPKAQQERVFQKFFRAENVAKIETDGTGLGLYLVKAIIESSGGKVWFSSEEGKGTTFWFSLPMAGMKAKAGEVTLDV